MMFMREGYNENYIRTSMCISGIFEDGNLNADEIKTKSIYSDLRRKIAEEVTRGSETFYRYNIVATINHGLARQKIPLPSGIPIQLTFNRAEATKGLLQISDKNSKNEPFSFTDKVVTIINPTLSCYFVESHKADAFYSKSKMYDVSINFLDYSLRRELLLENVADFNIKLFEGPLPSVLLVGFMKPKVFSGDFEYSALRFEKHNLDYLELQVDSQPIVGHPLRMNGENSIDFFTNYLRSTNRFLNPYIDSSLTYGDFATSNFLIFNNLKANNYNHGQLTVKMRFKAVLDEKLLFIFIPVYEKKIVFDSYKNVQVQN